MSRGALGTVLPLLLLLLSITRAESQLVVAEETIRQVVVAKPTGGFYRRGTAFHVGGGIFYTNAHVVKSPVPEGFTDWYLASTTSTRSRATWLGPFNVTCVHPRWRDPGDPNKSYPYDVARLKIENDPALPALTLHNQAPIVGQRVTIMGFPSASRGWPPKLYTSTGYVSQVFSPEHVFGIEVQSGFTVGGTSGSPVLAENGRVVGIIYTRTTPPGTIQFAVFTSAALEGCPL